MSTLLDYSTIEEDENIVNKVNTKYGYRSVH